MQKRRRANRLARSRRVSDSSTWGLSPFPSTRPRKYLGRAADDSLSQGIASAKSNVDYTDFLIDCQHLAAAFRDIAHCAFFVAYASFSHETFSYYLRKASSQFCCSATPRPHSPSLEKRSNDVRKNS